MRSCEVVIMRPCDIHRDGDVWSYEPYDHKNRWRGQRKLVPLGPKAQEILKSFSGARAHVIPLQSTRGRRLAQEAPPRPLQGKAEDPDLPIRATGKAEGQVSQAEPQAEEGEA